MMRRLLTALLTSGLLALAACAPPAAPAPQTAPGVGLPVAAERITAERMHARLFFLASDALRGRDTPSQGLEAAASYLASESQRMGLDPAGENGTFYQRWPFPLRRVSVEGTRLVVAGPRGPETLRFGRDFFAAGGAPGELVAPLVFAGQEIDLVADEAELFRDKIAVFALPGVGMARDWRMLRARQVAQAQQEGALAAILILDPGWTPEQIGQLAAQAGEPRRVLGEEVPFPQFLISFPAAERIFAAADVSLEEVWRRTLSQSSGSEELRPLTLPGLTATAGLPIERLDQAMPPNIVAMLPGSDPVLRDEYVLLSAHMDHVGVGAPMNGDSIYNGADDNASGTATLLEVARMLAASPERPLRSVIFLWVSGEEKGLLGSRWYSDNPTVPIEQIIANINVDMVGGDNHRDTVVVIGKDYSTLGEVVNRANARLPELRLIASDDIWPEQQFFFRSDQFNFMRREIPALFFFTGVHRCYHRPCDDIEFVDPEKAARVATLVLHTTREIANADRRPEWDPAGLEQVRRLTR